MEQGLNIIRRNENNLKPQISKDVKNKDVKNKDVKINLNKEEIKDFYYGLSNKSLWPLFHYFIEYSVFD